MQRNNGRKRGTNGIYGEIRATVPVDYGKGRWPANLLLDEGAAAMLDEQVGTLKVAARHAFSTWRRQTAQIAMRDLIDARDTQRQRLSPKINTSKIRRRQPRRHSQGQPPPHCQADTAHALPVQNGDPFKRRDPDPFMGSGSTGKAAMLEGFVCGHRTRPWLFRHRPTQNRRGQMQLPLLEAIWV